MSTIPIDQDFTEVKLTAQDEPDYRRYEALKNELSDELTPAEYSNAVREIARECGV